MDRKDLNAVVNSVCLGPGRTKPIGQLVILGILAGIAPMPAGLAIFSFDQVGTFATHQPIRAIAVNFVRSAVMGCWTWFSKGREEETKPIRDELEAAKIPDPSVSEKLA